MSRGAIAAELRDHFARMLRKGYEPTSLAISRDVLRELRADGQIDMSVAQVAASGGGGGSAPHESLLGLPIVYVDGMPDGDIVIYGAGGSSGAVSGGGGGAGGGVSWVMSSHNETPDERVARKLQEAVERVRARDAHAAKTRGPQCHGR